MLVFVSVCVVIGVCCVSVGDVIGVIDVVNVGCDG